ncbi:AAA ATPase midasin [Cryptotrichosporon argae]
MSGLSDVEMAEPADVAPTTPRPLGLDLHERSRLLLGDLGLTSAILVSPVSVPQIVFDFAADHAASPSALLDALSFLAAYDGVTDLVVSRFAPLALDLFARWLDSAQPAGQEEWEQRLAVLASLAEPRPDLWSLITDFLRRSPFVAFPLSADPSDQLALIPAPRLHRLLLAYWRLLVADPRLAARLDWPSAPLHALRTSHPDLGVRLLAIRILAKQRDWSETKRMEMERQWVGETESVVNIVFGRRVKAAQGGFEVENVSVDAWVMALHEARRVESYPTFEVLPTEPTNILSSTDLTPRVVLVGNALLLRSSTAPPPHGFVHVSTASMDAASASIAPLLERGLPVLVSAPPSAGKTHILQYLSTRLYPTARPTNRILTIALADTTIDVKSLIGTYVSSPTKPGTFEWMEGALAKAVRAGRWVVFEDIDKASLEMLVTISGLTRSLRRGRIGRRATLAVPGRDAIEGGDGFAIFATRTVRPDAAVPAAFFGHQHFHEVDLAPPSDDNILAILSVRFAKLPRALTTALVDIWRELRPLARRSGQVKARDVGLRDLEKWCARVDRSLPPPAALAALEQTPAGVFGNQVLQDEVFLEAADIFLACLDTKPVSAEKRAEMAAAIASRVGLDDERVAGLLDARRPRLEATRGVPQIHIGRFSLDAAPVKKRARVAADARPFALTRPSLVLLERIAAAVTMAEPTLLVGETGTGKTTAVQHLAMLSGRPLTALNLSTQTETSDLVGGFKPVDASAAARALHARWQRLFTETFSVAKAQNGAYLEAAAKALSAQKWGRCADLWSTSARRAVDKLNRSTDEADQAQPQPGSTSPRKRRKVNGKVAKAAVQWQALLVDISDFDLHHVKMRSKLVFSFVEGPLVRALRNGEWILLDEVNLASQETLEAVSTILEGSTASLVLTERGDVEPVPRHPDFRLFACMNPATDVGKKDLPPGLRARFTELYVPPPDDDREALVAIVQGYLGDAAAGDKAIVLDAVEMYSTLKRLSLAKEIVDGSNVAPHYSMRTLARALMFAVQAAPLFGLRRGLWEGALMAFTMSLDAASARRAHEVCEQHVLTSLKNARAVLVQVPALPAGRDADDYIRFGLFWLQRGPLPPATESRYIITPSVQAKLSDLARVILTRRYPVLIQGPTSAGKTSAVEFLAAQTGHRFVRINNHEHTDIQEYLGTYVTDPQTGALVFQEGLLVTAVRQGHWIVLDELNLAPTDVLEALNRLLDDNRELVIPETQEVITPHPNFILFATQNPPGLYAGRKVLSRAFRNRFLEVHFDDVPKDELETILCQRCRIAPSYAKRIVQVFEELRHRRQASRVFEAKQSFATLRDLFRWAERGAVGYDQLAQDGYMLLAERGRNDDDKAVIKQVIEDVMKVSIDVERMYRLFDAPADAPGILARLPFAAMPSSSLIWTRAMQRLFALVAAAAAHGEPVLLVGETGCGKTSICEVIAAAFDQRLVGVNCHQNMETADLLGSQRPVRNRVGRRAQLVARLSAIAGPLDASATDDDLLAVCAELAKTDGADQAGALECQRELKRLSALFEWSDGPLIGAMHAGDLLLLDEVSLADDSVLERLNSVLEPARTLVLAEKGGTDIDEATIVAHARFHVVATMNPGGDFGKKELSPALRNRFTEIWVPPLTDRNDLLQIVGQSLRHQELAPCAPLILDFLAWFGGRIGDASGLGLRDILAWVGFCNQMLSQGSLDVASAFHHGGQLVIVDGLESLHAVAGSSTSSIAALRAACLLRLTEMAATLPGRYEQSAPQVSIANESLDIGGFTVSRGSTVSSASAFRFEAPTTALNAMRVLRGCQLPKAILLEGSPGVGKTSLVSALAAVAGFHLQRINLSDQTDLIDLFGSDLPVEGGQAGEFQWRDAAFLDAMQKGDWVLLDEMNLASQTVLEGLNAVLDHRGTVFIPELGRSFDRHPAFRVFAAQNPLQQGGGRKGLPKSFLNRFTKVYLQEHTSEDLLMICRQLYPADTETVQRMICFNEAIREQTMVSRTIGREGSPWEFNLRDLFRWFQLLAKRNGLEASEHPVEYLRMVYLQRFRNERDRDAVERIFENVFGAQPAFPRPTPFVTPAWFQVGHARIRRSAHAAVDARVAHAHLDLAESVLKAVELGWLVILAGDAAAGKRALVRAVAAGAGQALGEFAMHPAVDTSEILGSFEQQDSQRLLDHALAALIGLVEAAADAQPSSAAHVQHLAHLRQRCADVAQLDAPAAFLAAGRAVIDALAGQLDTTAAAARLDQLARLGPGATGFAWVDGQLLEAIRTGGWYLISDANLCSASVLDRLNSLCEHDGVLIMSEKGSATGAPEVIRPHAQFRLFMTYDPRHGELSRAMRNRGVELHVEGAGGSVEGAPLNVVEGTYALADETLLDAYERARRASSPAPSSSSVANLVASQSAQAVGLLVKIDKLNAAAVDFVGANNVQATIATHADHIGAAQGLEADFVHALPLDAFLNPNIHTLPADHLFRTFQLVLRNAAASAAVEAWVADAVNAKSVLSTSALAHRRPASRRKGGIADHVYPFIATLRGLVQAALPGAFSLAATDDSILHSIALVLLNVALVEAHSRTDVFDYSSIKLLSSWLHDLITRVPQLAPAIGLAQTLAAATQLTAGLGQTQVWSVFRQGAPTHAARTAVIELVIQLDQVADSRLKINTVEALNTALVSGQLLDVADDLQALIASLPKAASVDSAWQDARMTSVIELSTLRQFVNATGIDAVSLDLLSTVAGYPASGLLHLTNATRGPASGVFTAVSAWLGRLWSSVDGQQRGPGDIFAPVLLSASLRFSDDEPVPMSAIGAMDDALRSTTDTVLYFAGRREDRVANAYAVARACLDTLLQAFGAHVAVEKGAAQLVVFTGDASYAHPLRHAFNAHLAAPLAAGLDLHRLGQIWLGFACFLLDLFVTNIPIDPGVRRVLLGESVALRLELELEEFSAVAAAEVVQRGVADSRRVQHLAKNVEGIKAEQDALGPTIDREVNASRLGLLFNEVHAFLSEVFTQHDDLLDALAAHSGTAVQREQSFQLASAAFVHRLSKNYDDLFDLVQPITTAVLCAKFGLCLAARHAELARAPGQAMLGPALAFPRTRSLATLQALPLPSRLEPSPESIRTDMLVATAHACDMAEAEQRAQHAPRLIASLDRLYQAWSAIRLREQQEAQAAESLYRVRKADNDVLSDEEQEAKEFAELFPTYEDDAATEQIQPDKQEDTSAAAEAAKFQPSHVAAFHALVSNTFGEDAAGSKAHLLDAAIGSIVRAFRPSAHREDLDEASTAYQIAVLYHRRAQTKTSPAHVNFYTAANEFEIRKAHALVSRLIARLDAIIDEWPEQMVLQHIRDRCERILGLHIQSPVAQVLSAVEQLLVHTDDWEAFANRDNSLKSFQLDMSSLIVGWRRLELASWVRLLDDQAAAYVRADDEWTLRLYGAVVHGAVSADNADKYIDTVLPMISTFINTASLGTYEARLATLTALQRIAVSQAPASPVLARIAVVLHNLLANARLYLARVRDGLHTQRALIDKAIKDFVKLASWKDINVFALKASAQKSHKQLHRNMRKFRDVLRQPVAPILGDPTAIVPQLPPTTSHTQAVEFYVLSEVSASAIETRASADVPVPSVLERLGDTAAKYASVHARTRSAIDLDAAPIDSMAVEIIETAAALAKATPLTLTKDNAKAVNNLASRKRKAYADLLKALRAAGFSQNVPADKMAHQLSSKWMAARPALSVDDLPAAFDKATIAKVDDYHHRQAVLMANLRAALAGHSPDIATQDLQRGIGFAESLYATSLKEREVLATSLQQLSTLSPMLDRLRILARSTSVRGGSQLDDALRQAQADCAHFHDALRELETGIRQFRELQGAAPAPDDVEAVHTFRHEFALLVRALEQPLASARATGVALFAADEVALLGTAEAARQRLADACQIRAQATPELGHLFKPLADMAACQVTPVPDAAASLPDAIWQESDSLVQALLVVAQGMAPTSDSELAEVDYPHVPSAFARQSKMFSSLRVADLTSRLAAFASALGTAQASTAMPACVVRVLPFLEAFAETHAQAVLRHAHTVKASSKLAYVVGRVMLDLAQRGFCKPQEESDDKQGADETVEGTGMGSGSGDKNVSAEITEESQVEGLQGEEEEQDNKDKNEGDDGDDDAVSMDEDFEGALDDAKEGEEGEDESGDEDSHDEHTGDVDPLDPGAVDEKFWGDDEEKEDKEGGGNDLMNQKNEEQGESDMAAKEGESSKDDKKDDKEKKEDKDKDRTAEPGPEEQERQTGDEVDFGDEGDDENEQDGGENEDEGAEQGNQDQVEAPEGDRLDLPDDLDLGGDEDGEDEQPEFADDDINMGDDADDADGPPEDNGVSTDDEGEAKEDAPAAAGATDEDAHEQEETMNQNLDVSASNDAVAQEAAAAGQGQGAAQEQEQEQEAGEEEVELDAAEEQAEADVQGAADNAAKGGGSADQQDADGPADSAGARFPQPQQQEQTQRSLGDMMKEIQRRRDEIFERTEREDERATPDAEAAEQKPGQVEYLQEGDADENMQALGPAREEAQKLEDLKIVDDDEGEAPPAIDEEDEAGADADGREADTTAVEREPLGGEQPQGMEKALTQADIVGNALAGGDGMDVDADDSDLELATDIKADVTDDDDADVDLTIADPAATDASPAEDLWRQYASVTSDLSYALCEQLRLILEPTLATRLQGDFRTGKRLNMRKIIPYIASEYTKDKIWLRRTKPSRREYQVLLSLDDSRSMAESSSVALAYQTLALVAQALNKLEVGQLAVARFGEAVDVLHPFKETFADADGARVMRAFTFTQHRTDVARLVERTLAYLADSRHAQAATGAADLWQLQIIISDGVCQDHAKLRTLLRRAVEERVMIVFLVVDSLAQQPAAPAPARTDATAPPAASTQRTSILSMQTVNYTNVGGEMKIEMARYLDTFPFDFYVVLRDVEALPGVLADTLRQWMARVSQSQE